MNASLDGKAAIVTGAADGIGRATAVMMAASGAKVLLVDIDEPRLAESTSIITREGGRAISMIADVSDEAAVISYVERAVSEFGRIDAFFNNAGILGARTDLINYPVDVFDKVMAVNSRGVFLGLKHVLTVMVDQKAGSIINTGSMASAGGMPGFAAYGAAKHAVIGLTKVAAIEVAPMNVRVNAVLPGNIRTKIALAGGYNWEEMERLSAALTPQGRVGEPHELAAAVCFLASDAASHITGVELNVDGGILASSYGHCRPSLE